MESSAIELSGRRVWVLVCVLWGVLSSHSTAWADLYSCQETGAVSIDPYQREVIDGGGADTANRRWLVDTDQGWHRAEFPATGVLAELRMVT